METAIGPYPRETDDSQASRVGKGKLRVSVTKPGAMYGPRALPAFCIAQLTYALASHRGHSCLYVVVTLARAGDRRLMAGTCMMSIDD